MYDFVRTHFHEQKMLFLGRKASQVNMFDGLALMRENDTFN